MVQETPVPDEGPHRLPSLPADLKRTYEGLVQAGATSPADGQDLKTLSKQLHENKRELDHELHVLEGKGVVGHLTSGNETVWYARR